MPLPELVPSIAPEIEATTQTKLAALEDYHEVRVMFAVKSGSRRRSSNAASRSHARGNNPRNHTHRQPAWRRGALLLCKNT